jgi:hypothetical protein
VIETISLNRVDGRLNANDLPVGILKSDNHAQGEVLFGPAEYTYRVYKPIERGYNIGLFRGNVEVCTISHVWREGYTVTRSAGPEFSYYERRLVQGNTVFAQVQLEPNSINVVFSKDLPESERAELACALTPYIVCVSGGGLWPSNHLTAHSSGRSSATRLRAAKFKR